MTKLALNEDSINVPNFESNLVSKIQLCETQICISDNNTLILGH